MPDNFRNSACTGGNDRNAGSGGLKQGNAQAFHHGRVNNKIQAGQNTVQIVAEAGKDHMSGDALPAA